MSFFRKLSSRKRVASATVQGVTVSESETAPVATVSATDHVYKCPYCGSVLEGARPGKNTQCMTCYTFFRIIDDSGVRYTDQYGKSEFRKYRVIFSVGFDEWCQYEFNMNSAREVTAMLEGIRTYQGPLDGAAANIRSVLIQPKGGYYIKRAYVDYLGNIISFCGAEDWNRWVANGEAAGEF